MRTRIHYVSESEFVNRISGVTLMGGDDVYNQVRSTRGGDERAERDAHHDRGRARVHGLPRPGQGRPGRVDLPAPELRHAAVLCPRAERRLRAARVLRQLPRLLRRPAPLSTAIRRRRVLRATDRPSGRPTGSRDRKSVGYSSPVHVVKLSAVRRRASRVQKLSGDWKCTVQNSAVVPIAYQKFLDMQCRSNSLVFFA